MASTKTDPRAPTPEAPANETPNGQPEKSEFDWGDLTGQATERLRAPKVPPVPAQIVKLAQDAYDGRTLMDPQGKPVTDDEGNPVITHNLRHDFKGDEKRAEAFAKHMKNAGLHTTPLTSLSVVIDPDDDGNKSVVAWRATKRRGRQTAN